MTGTVLHTVSTEAHETRHLSLMLREMLARKDGHIRDGFNIIWQVQR